MVVRYRLFNNESFFNDQMVEVEVITFVTNTKGLFPMKSDGMIGLAPCPTGMGKYSFVHQLDLIDPSSCNEDELICRPTLTESAHAYTNLNLQIFKRSDIYFEYEDVQNGVLTYVTGQNSRNQSINYRQTQSHFELF